MKVRSQSVDFYLSTQATALKVFPAEAPNNTNIDEVIKQAAANDGELQEINLNNIKYISTEKWEKLFTALADNSMVESLSAANCDITDSICKMLCFCLEVKHCVTALASSADHNLVTQILIRRFSIILD